MLNNLSYRLKNKQTIIKEAALKAQKADGVFKNFMREVLPSIGYNGAKLIYDYKEDVFLIKTGSKAAATEISLCLHYLVSQFQKQRVQVKKIIIQ